MTPEKKKRKPTKLQVVGRKYRRAVSRVERLKNRIYGVFLSASRYRDSRTPIPEPHATATLSAKWCDYTGYAPKEQGERLLNLLRKAERILTIRNREYDAVLGPRREKLAQRQWEKVEAASEESKRRWEAEQEEERQWEQWRYDTLRELGVDVERLKQEEQAAEQHRKRIEWLKRQPWERLGFAERIEVKRADGKGVEYAREVLRSLAGMGSRRGDWSYEQSAGPIFERSLTPEEWELVRDEIDDGCEHNEAIAYLDALARGDQ